MSNKYALLVGINEYQDQNIRPLSGALNDVQRMRSTLIGKFDFPAENVVSLENEQATRDAILSVFRSHLIAKADDDAIVLFFFSGHGAQVNDEEGGDETADGLDETLVPWDSTNSGARDITDDTINALLKELSEKTRNVTFIFDSCSSGTGTRGSGAVRRIDRNLGDSVEITDDAAVREDNLNYTLIAAARSNELAREYSHDGITYGALTYFLTEELDSIAGEQVTYRDVMDIVSRKVNALHTNQNPTLEGVAADSLVFGDRDVLQQKAVLVVPADSRDTVYLDAGLVHGATEGSVFRIYPPRTRIFEPPSEQLATATIVHVGPRRSLAKLDLAATIPPGSRAVQIEHSFGDSKLQVYVEGSGLSPRLAAITAELDNYNFVEMVPTSPYHLLLDEKNGAIRIEAADSKQIAAISTDEPGFEQRVVDKVIDWGKWFNVLSISNPSPPNKVGFKFSLSAITEAETTRSPYDHVGRPDAEFYAGEQVVLNIESRSKTDLYVHILVLSTDGSIEPIPLDRSKDGDLLKKGKSLSFNLGTCLPKGHTSIIDVVKVIAHTDRLNLEFLQRRPLTRSQSATIEADSPVEQLIANAGLGAEKPRSAVPLDKWISEQRVILVKESLDGKEHACP